MSFNKLILNNKENCLKILLGWGLGSSSSLGDDRKKFEAQDLMTRPKTSNQSQP